MFTACFTMKKRSWRGNKYFTVCAHAHTRAGLRRTLQRKLNADKKVYDYAIELMCAGIAELTIEVKQNGAKVETMLIKQFHGVKTLSVIDGNIWEYRKAYIVRTSNGVIDNGGTPQTNTSKREVLNNASASRFNRVWIRDLRHTAGTAPDRVSDLRLQSRERAGDPNNLCSARSFNNLFAPNRGRRRALRAIESALLPVRNEKCGA